MNTHPIIPHRISLRSTLHLQLHLRLLTAILITGFAVTGLNGWAVEVPYRGEVSGAVVCDMDLQNPTATAKVRSHPLGPGTQVFESLTLAVSTADGMTWLDTGGVAITTTASRKNLRIHFGLHGVFLGPTTVLYTGTFEVIPGGTGPFAFPGVAAGLGGGFIEGWAELTPDYPSGTLVFRFRHFFAGTLCSIGDGVRLGRDGGGGGS